jgi:RHH-type proline utilization regulon transcriptional repressor/proline dehydrogenase/delta 1-pyrroline-5-carboxylate dehydrogenase
VRIYAPVGSHKELLAYLVRRLLENGANSSFVNRIADAEVSLEDLLSDPVAQLEALEPLRNPPFRSPARCSAPIAATRPAATLPILPSASPACTAEAARGQALDRRAAGAGPRHLVRAPFDRDHIVARRSRPARTPSTSC